MPPRIKSQEEIIATIEKKEGRISVNESTPQDAIAKKMMKLLAYKIHKEIVMTERVDTGRLRSSTTVNKVSDFHWIVGTNVEYAPYVEARFGTYLRASAKIPQFLKEIKLKLESQ